MCFSHNTYGQAEEIDFQTWTDFTFTYAIKNRINVGADLGVRGLVSKNDWNQFYFRPAFQYYFNRRFIQITTSSSYQDPSWSLRGPIRSEP